MADLAIAPQHNMIAYLEKTKNNAEFHQIVDFLTSSSIHHFLTIFKTLLLMGFIFDGMWRNLDGSKKKHLMYPRFLQIFLKNQIPDLVELLNDVYVTPTLTKKVFSSMIRKREKFSGTVTPLFATMLAQPAVVEGEGGGDSLVRAATTASLDAQQDSRNITKTQSKAILNEPTPQGEGSGSGPGRQETMRGAMAQIRSEGALIQSIDPLLSTGYTVGSEEDRMEHDIELTDPIPQTPHDSPLSGGFHPFRAGTSKRHSLGRRKVSKQGRKNLKSQKMFQDIDDVLDEDANTEMIVEDKEVSTAEPKTPPTTATLFDDEDVTIADTLIQAHLDEEARTKRERQEEASKAALAEIYDEVQAQIDADHELAVRLTHEEQEKYTVEERFTHVQLKSRSFKEIQNLYIKEHKWVDAFIPIGSEEDEKRIGSRKKRAVGSSSKHKSPKKQKVNDQEFEDTDKEHRKCLKVVPDDDRAIYYETLDVKSLIVDCESQVLGTNEACC
nr:hypothetical protein [Tanacetum cinerariifolium]